MNYQLNVPISETELQTVMEKQNRLRARLLAFREQESSRCRTLPVVESESTKLKARLLNEAAISEFRKNSNSKTHSGIFNRSKGSNGVKTVHEKAVLDSNKAVPENAPLTNIFNENSYNLKPMIDLNCLNNNSSHAYVNKELPVLVMSGAHSVQSAQSLSGAKIQTTGLTSLLLPQPRKMKLCQPEPIEFLRLSIRVKMTN